MWKLRLKGMHYLANAGLPLYNQILSNAKYRLGFVEAWLMRLVEGLDVLCIICVGEIHVTVHALLGISDGF